ncbi:tetraspanin-13a isoform X3 [Siniperca chuatsi]|uniref:tetraspanin-13a isoform X3 n=1 Tax=Siniperca chuatsi TaxID=119488 RepID=UPI001CE08260|nr:tetraspanin-13a isoform X3 [Siniperca chuatsi]
MVCGGFICTKNALCALNILYVLVSLLLIGVAAWGKWFGLVSSIRVVAGVIGVGIFLFLVAFVGLCGALKHHQNHLLEVGWNKSEATQKDVEKTLDCCGFSYINYNGSCAARCFHNPLPSCKMCSNIIQEYAGEVLQFVGGIGLFFSFTEILGVWLAHRYRNIKDPRSNPGAFL